MQSKKFQEILEKHKKWLAAEDGGKRADLTYANLTYANLTYANLTGANLTYANLTYANLSYANLFYANLSYADLTYANLTYANLDGANLTYANLDGANLKIFQAGCYTAYIQPTHTRIGCKYHTNKQWLSFSDDDISNMASGTLKWWTENKPIIQAIMESLNKEGE